MAKKFQFRLQRLLEIREHKEKLIKNELGKARSKKVKELNKKMRAVNNINKSLKSMKNEEKNKVLSISRIMQYQNYFKKLKVDMENQDKIISIIDEEINMINNKLVEARKNKKVLERLKERKMKKYVYEVGREEQNFFDDIGNVEFVRQLREHKKILSQEKQEIPIKYKEKYLQDVDFIHQIYQEVFGEV